MGFCCSPKCWVAVSLLLALLAYNLYFPVPEGIPDANRLRFTYAMIKTINFVGSITETLGFASSIDLMRSLTKLSVNVTSKDDPDLEVTDTKFDGVVVRIYKPKAAPTPSPAVVYFHGGGWVFLNIDGYDPITSHFAKAANIVVVSVEYRLAPEHPFPVPFEDCLRATTHLLLNAQSYGVDAKRVAVAGDSAGGNLAAAVALRLSEEPEDTIPRLKLQILVYPALQALSFTLPSYREFGNVGMLTDYDMVKFWLSYTGRKAVRDAVTACLANRHTTSQLRTSQYGQYVSPDALPSSVRSQGVNDVGDIVGTDEALAKELEPVLTNPYFAPLMASKLEKVAPAVLLIADKDVLRDDGLLYYERLQKTGVKSALYHDLNGFHGCMSPMFNNEWLSVFVKYLKSWI